MAKQFSLVVAAGALAFALFSAVAFGQSSTPAPGKDDHPAAAANTTSQSPEQLAPSKTSGTISVEGKTIAYTAVAGTLDRGRN